MKNTVHSLVLGTAFLIALGLVTSPALAVQVGDVLKNVNIKDAEDEPATIPYWGEKVLTIFYTDPDVSDQNDPFADLLDAANLPEAKHKGIGIANMKDAPLKPNFVIRAIIRGKIEKYDTIILTDPDQVIPGAWNLGDCNDLSVVLVIDKTGTVRYVKKGAMSRKDQEEAMAIIRGLIGE